MRHLPEIAVEVASHAHGGRIVVCQLGTRRFELLQLVHEGIELAVGYFGLVLHIIQIIMAVQCGSQGYDTLFLFHTKAV